MPALENGSPSQEQALVLCSAVRERPPAWEEASIVDTLLRSLVLRGLEVVLKQVGLVSGVCFKKN